MNQSYSSVRTLPRPQSKKWIARGILLVLVAGGLYALPLKRWVEQIPWFHVREIVVETELPLTEKEIRDSIPLDKKTSLLTIDAESLMLRLKSLIWVDQATVKKEFPNRLFVKTTPRLVSALWIQDGYPFYVDSRGILIERMDKRPIANLRLPIITHEKGVSPQWSRAQVLEAVHRIQRSLEPDFLVSELNLETFPYFRVFLTPVPLEVTFDFTTWSTQLPYLVLLLRHPPLLASQPRKINLVFPKKTIVTTQENK